MFREQGRAVSAFALVLIVGSTLSPGQSAQAGDCPRCGWSPPKPAATLTVGPEANLYQKISRAKPGTTILLEDGVYRLSGALQILAPDLTLRSKREDRTKVALLGPGMEEEQVRIALSVEAPRFTLSDLTIGRVGWSGIQVQGGAASDLTVHNVRVFDTGQQLLKANPGRDGRGSDRGLVACSTFEYTDSAPSDYTNGVDVHRGRDWIVRDCRFLRIRGPRDVGYRAGPAILFWNDARDTIVERNGLLDCHRGIAFGLGPRQGPEAPEGGFDHQGGLIRQNLVLNLQPWADEGIEVSACRDIRIEHNTVFVTGRVPWSISLRFAQTQGTVLNNLGNRRIALRDGAKAQSEANIGKARADWFVDLAHGDLRLARGDLPAIDAARPIPGLVEDFYRRPRRVGPAPDIGAIEFVPPSSAP